MQSKRMKHTVLVEFWGGFHAQMCPITVRLDRKTCEGTYGGTPINALHELPRTEARVMKHLCGSKDCMCGLHHGVQWGVK